MKLKCKVVRTVFSKDDYRVFGVIPLQESEVKLNKYGNFTISGNLSYLDEGKEYTMEIEEGTTNKYGVQYVVKDVPSMKVENLTDDNEIKYLEQITTKSQAMYIHQAYPDFIRKILNGEENEIDVKKIYNVGEYRLNAYIRDINTKFKFFQIVNMFPQYSLSIEDSKELCKALKILEEVKKEMVKNPYACLIEILGRSFEKSDRMITEYNSEFIESDIRTEFLILDVLKRNEYDGSSKINANVMASFAKEYAPECIKNIKRVAVESDRIYYDDETKYIAKMGTYVAECGIAQFIKERIEYSNTLDIEHGWEEFVNVGELSLSEKQTQILKNFTKYSFNILLGYSGTGKSTSILSLVKMLEANHLSYTLLAPTGRASKRLSECTNRNASTIHRATPPMAEITSDVVVVDEFSMVDIELCYRLFNAITRRSTRIVLVGDNAQLSSIGCGNVFNDMIESKVIPIAFLDEVFRYAEGGTLKVATDIRNGKSYFKNNDGVQKFGKDFTFMQADNDTAFDLLIQQYKKALNKYKPTEIMVLSPFNVGEIGTYNINNTLQLEVNPPKPNENVMIREIGNVSIVFRKGDYVLNTKNDYKALTLEEYERLNKLEESDLFLDDELEIEDYSLEPKYTTVYNGDMGVVRSIDSDKMVVQIDQEMIVYEKNKISNNLLSYSISTHKSQGGEAKCVINLSLPMHRKMLTKNILYVADTRGKEQVIEIGDRATIEEAIKISEENDRETFLKEELIRVLPSKGNVD